MKREDRKYRTSLTLLFAGIILIFLIATLLISTVVGYLFIELNIIPVTEDTEISTSKVLLLLSINSLIFGSILSTLTCKYTLKPVNTIISKMNQLSTGNYKARLSFKGLLSKIPVVKEIGESFNVMAEELDNTEMLRSDFINNFSHEFKTPIVSIAGFAKLLKRGNLTEEQMTEYIDIIEEESMRLSTMATNVLDLTKYENQTILTDVTEFNLSEQIRSCILTLEGKWAKKNIDFNLNFNERMICGNKDMLKHAWINLIDNAIKFSEQSGVVDIEIREIGEKYAVAISNHGVEISPEHQAKIFNKFYQADESHATEGNGIGLALVKGVTNLHNGQITVNSQNGITTFTVILPKKQ